MTIEPHGKKFDCVAFMREAQDRISDTMATMSREEFRHWLRSYRTPIRCSSAFPTRRG